MQSLLKKDLQKLADPARAKILSRFFKTGKGEYGEGDVFLGIKVPEQRKMVNKYGDLTFTEIQSLLNSKVHEERLIALLILVHQYQKLENKKEVVDFYLKNTKYINNWDLVDLSAPNILGDYFLDKDKKTLYQLARSKDWGERRISILSTFTFIRNNHYEDALKISEILLGDQHDLIHKAVGWMLREIGKRDQVVEEKFLQKHYSQMPRTMLRYAIEKFGERKRRAYLRR